MRRSNRNLNIPPPQNQAGQTLGILTFEDRILKIPAPHEPMWCSNALPYRISLSNALPKEQFSVFVVSNKACVYSRYAETLIQDGKLF